MIKRKLIVNEGKMKEMGGGSVAGFARKFNLDRTTIENIKRRTTDIEREGSKNQATRIRLIELGVAEWEEYRVGVAS